MTDKSPGQPHLQIETLGIAEGDGEQHIATPSEIADARYVPSLGRQAQEPPVDLPVTGGLDGMCQRLHSQPLPPVVFTQGLWHGYGSFQAKPAWQPQLMHGIFIIAIRLISFLDSPNATASKSLDKPLYTAYASFQHDQHLSARRVCLSGEVWGAPGVSLRRSWGWAALRNM
ncbi:MAG: hypothetical protein E5V81_20670 [Mesorhizobium sp.]|nr:MAG: hypothetical protein E5V81_20670 [Mesorhizobium sp.]